MKNNIRKNFVWNTIGLTFYSFSSLLFLIIVNNINKSNIAGIFSYSFSITTVFFYIALFYNRTFQVSNKKIKFNDFFSTRIFMCFLSLVLILIFTIVSDFSFFKITIILLLMLYRIIDAISDCFYGFFQSDDKLYLSGISYFLKSIFGIFLFFVIDLLTKNIVVSLLFLNLSSLLVMFSFDYYNFKKYTIVKLKFSKQNIFQILKITFSIFIFQFFSIYLVNSTKLLINYFATNELQTIFAILIMPATLLSIVGNYIIQPFISKLCIFNDKKNYSEFSKLVLLILITLLICGLLVISVSYFVGIPILNFIYLINLDNYKLVLMIILVGSIFNSASLIISNVLTILDKNKIQVCIYGICSFLSTICCWLTMKYNPIVGGAFSYTLINFIIMLWFLCEYKIVIRKKECLNMNKKDIHSFIICAYNCEETLEDCIISLKNQTMKSKVYLSTSKPNKIMKDLCNKYDIEMFINKEKSSHIKDFNYALSKAKTKYVTLCHQDDEYMPNFAENVVSKMEKYDDSLISFTNYYENRYSNRKSKIVKFNNILFVKRILNFPLLIFKKNKNVRLFLLSLGNAICAPTVTYNTSLIEKSLIDNGFKSNIDWITYIDFAKKNGRFIYLKEPLLLRRIHENSTTTSVIADDTMTKESKQIFEMFWPKFFASFLVKIYSKSENSNKLK